MAHILICDDDATVRNLVKDVLSMSGHTFDEAENGSLAIAALKKKPYALLIIDRNMPVMDGIQTVTLLRTDARFKDMPVIMCTSVSITKEVDEAFQAGANDYLLKPVSVKHLIDKVAKWTAGK